MRYLALALASTLAIAAATVAFAQPDNKGHGKGGPPAAAAPPSGASRQGGTSGPSATHGSVSVSDRDRNEVYSYYRQQYSAGHCPPGLAKKNNGCVPPGQANKMWSMGQPLPSNVMYEPLPRDLMGRLSPAPSGYQYVRVANDVLMMAVGSRMIVGALADLSAF